MLLQSPEYHQVFQYQLNHLVFIISCCAVQTWIKEKNNRLYDKNSYVNCCL